MHVSEEALFPLPVPKPGVFKVAKCGSRERRKRRFDQAFHVFVMALNFWHSDFHFIPVELMTRPPNKAQAKALENLRALMRAFGSCREEFHVPGSGRRLPTLVSLLDDLSDFLTREGHGSDPYSRAFPGAPEPTTGTVLERDFTKAEELILYRTLDPARLALFGCFLGSFTLPF